MKKKGYGGVEHFPPMDQEDLKTLYTDCHALNSNTPVGLQNKVWFEIMFYLCRRGRENLRTMTMLWVQMVLEESTFIRGWMSRPKTINTHLPMTLLEREGSMNSLAAACAQSSLLIGI